MQTFTQRVWKSPIFKVFRKNLTQGKRESLTFKIALLSFGQKKKKNILHINNYKRKLAPKDTLIVKIFKLERVEIDIFATLRTIVLSAHLVACDDLYPLVNRNSKLLLSFQRWGFRKMLHLRPLAWIMYLKEYWKVFKNNRRNWKSSIKQIISF